MDNAGILEEVVMSAPLLVSEGTFLGVEFPEFGWLCVVKFLKRLGVRLRSPNGRSEREVWITWW